MDVRKRPIVGTTPDGVGITYIILDPWTDDVTVQCIANGTVTFTLDSTIKNILYDTAAQNAVNIGNDDGRYVDPASAIWGNQIVSGSASASVNIPNDELIFALRVNITAGTGSVTYTVNQG
jgi:hypothetical protein